MVPRRWLLAVPRVAGPTQSGAPGSAGAGDAQGGAAPVLHQCHRFHARESLWFRRLHSWVGAHLLAENPLSRR